MSFHPRTRAGFLAGACLLLAHVACSVPTPTTASYYLAAPLVAPGGGPAHGKLEAHLSMLMRSLYVEVYQLEPYAEYSIAIEDVRVADFAVGPDGSGYVTRGVDAIADPRGRRIAIVDASGAEVLVLAEPSHPQYVELHDAPLSAFAPGGGRTSLSQIAGTRSLVVRLEDVDPGAYDVFADGAWVSDLDAASGSAKTVVDAAGLADDTAIEVQLDGIGYFAGSTRALIFGLDWCSLDFGQQSFVAAGGGSAVASLRTFVDCGRQLVVTLRQVPEGDYDLTVGGAVRGVISVGVDENGETVGEIYFGTDERGAAQLHFDPVGAPLEVQSNGITHFTIGSFQP